MHCYSNTIVWLLQRFGNTLWKCFHQLGAKIRSINWNKDWWWGTLDIPLVTQFRKTVNETIFTAQNCVTKCKFALSFKGNSVWAKRHIEKLLLKDNMSFYSLIIIMFSEDAKTSQNWWNLCLIVSPRDRHKNSRIVP